MDDGALVLKLMAAVQRVISDLPPDQRGRILRCRNFVNQDFRGIMLAVRTRYPDLAQFQIQNRISYTDARAMYLEAIDSVRQSLRRPSSICQE